MKTVRFRSMYIARLLYVKTDKDHRYTAQMIVDELAGVDIDAERKTIYRDIAGLREIGMSIVRTSSGFYVDKRVLTLSELKLLLSAVQAAVFITPEATSQLCKKLQSLASCNEAKELLSSQGISTIKCKNDDAMKTISDINLAIASKKQITFQYVKIDPSFVITKQRQGGRYVLSPYAMIWMHDRYYLVGNLLGRNDLTHFRTDRIQAMRVENLPIRDFSEVSEYVGVFDVADYALKCVNMFGGAVEDIVLSCDVALINEIFDKFGNDIEIISKDSLTFTVKVSAVAGDGFIAWVSQFGNKIEIIRPEHLRNSMEKRILKMAELYQI